jgi:hypothetical protein
VKPEALQRIVSASCGDFHDGRDASESGTAIAALAISIAQVLLQTCGLEARPIAAALRPYRRWNPPAFAPKRPENRRKPPSIGAYARATNLVLALAITAWEAERRPGSGMEARARRLSDSELEGPPALSRRPENGERRSAAGDPQVAAEAAFFARRWPTSGEKGEGVYWGPVFISARRGGRMTRSTTVPMSPQVSTVQSVTVRE